MQEGARKAQEKLKQGAEMGSWALNNDLWKTGKAPPQWGSIRQVKPVFQAEQKSKLLRDLSRAEAQAQSSGGSKEWFQE